MSYCEFANDSKCPVSNIIAQIQESLVSILFYTQLMTENNTNIFYMCLYTSA